MTLSIREEAFKKVKKSWGGYEWFCPFCRQICTLFKFVFIFRQANGFTKNWMQLSKVDVVIVIEKIID